MGRKEGIQEEEQEGEREEGRTEEELVKGAIDTLE